MFLVGSQWYCYIPITKVASTYLRRALPGRQFNIHRWQWFDSGDAVPDRPSVRFLVMLRDPVERWLSGAVEFWCRARPDRDWTDTGSHDDLFEQVEFDIHTRPQRDFVHGIDSDRTTWLWMQPSVDHIQWFKDQAIELRSVDVQERNWGNTRPQIYFDHQGNRHAQAGPGLESSTPSHVIQIALAQMLTPERKHSIRRYYQQDQELIDSVKFENPPLAGSRDLV